MGTCDSSLLGIRTRRTVGAKFNTKTIPRGRSRRTEVKDIKDLEYWNRPAEYQGSKVEKYGQSGTRQYDMQVPGEEKRRGTQR